MTFDLGEICYHRDFRAMAVITGDDDTHVLYNPLIKFKSFLHVYSAPYVDDLLSRIIHQDIETLSSQIIAYL